jgi:retinol dehydrogenase-12
LLLTPLICQNADGSKTAQDYELQLGTNCVGPFLFTKLLTPVLISTAKTAPEGSVRVVWVSSSGAEMSPTNGVEFDNLDYKEAKSTYQKYFISKAGNVLHALEFENRYKKDGVISVVCDMAMWKSPVLNWK